MEIESAKKLFTVDEYYRMAEAGILGPQDRVELIDGEVIRMSPIGVPHAGLVNRANRLLGNALRGRATISVQNPLQLSDYTEPEPDVVVLKPRPDDYANKKVRAEDVFWVIEVSDTTLSYDRDVKVPRYAAAGIPEVWIEDINGRSGRALLAFRDPTGKAYRTLQTLAPGDSISPLAFPDVQFQVRELLD